MFYDINYVHNHSLSFPFQELAIRYIAHINCIKQKKIPIVSIVL